MNAPLAQVMRELEALKRAEENERAQAQKDEATIQHLQARLDELQARAATPATQSSPPTGAAPPAAPPSPDQFAAAMDQYLGQHQFTFTGAAAGSFIYDRQANTNTFALSFEPIVLYRLNDWLLFEGTVEAALPSGSSADFQLPVATAQIQLNDYAEINAGIFDQPFGDWYEDQSPFWVNRFVTAPLLYGAEAIIPPTDLGVQLRGGIQWGALGEDADYTVWAANGPGFDSSLPRPIVGETLNPVNNIGLNSNGRTFGARFRVYPLPLDSSLGRLELGASTLNGKWLGGNWFNSWGVDFAYLKDGLQARGEWVQTYRTVPGAGPGTGKDNRQGWYVQVGYFLENLPLTVLPDRARNVVHHFEPLVRYSGVNQTAVVGDEITTTPQLGFNGSPSVFTPHAREVALGLDYWFAPSIVLQNEFDLELPEAGGTLYSFNGASTPTAQSIGPTVNDFAFLSQIAIGF